VFFGVAKTEDGRLVGLITMRLPDSGELGLVSRLYVHPEYQRRGIGAALLQAAVAAFPTVKRLRLVVEEQNHKGRAFYAKQGFHQIEVKQEEISGIALETLVLEKEL
jgi:ribosomal protein S18 acetylase RimI-like enzyme